MNFSWEYLKPKLKKYFWNLLVALDQFINTVLGGDPDETISSRVAKLRVKSKAACIFCKFLSFFDARHCDEHLEADEGKNDVLK